MMQLAETTRVTADRLHVFTSAICRAVGMSPEDAAVMADLLVWRDLRDALPLGLPALPSFLKSVREGTTDPAAIPVVVRERGSTVLFDARRAWGQVAATRAMRAAADLARVHGVGVAVVRNSGTANAMGYYPTIAIERQLIGLAATNSPPLQPPWGGTTRVLGNQAFAFGAPAGRHQPVLFDSASTAISRSRINLRKVRGEPLPEGVALDADGRPTTDPAAALLGSLLPLGGHKGYGLSVMWEVLTGILSGGERFGANIPPEGSSAPDVSLFLIAIDPQIAMSYDDFVRRVDGFIDQLHASPPPPDGDRVLAPGERGYLQAERRRAEGIPIPPARVAELTALAEPLGVAW
jgi:LDH2 family malate/lactate/ureidoglycolate dehydrogenase